MKKYLLGLFAIALAVGFSAFTAVKNHRAPVVLTFQGNAEVPGDITTNTLYEDLGAPSCQNPNHRLCSITVDDQYVDNSTSPATLVSTVSITATQIGSTTFYQPSATEITGLAKKAD